jgi:hypothetical protein
LAEGLLEQFEALPGWLGVKTITHVGSNFFWPCILPVYVAPDVIGDP